MKMLIDNAGGYLTYGEVIPFKNPAHAGWVTLRISTVWEGARSDVEEQVKYELNLTPEAFQNFKNMINKEIS